MWWGTSVRTGSPGGGSSDAGLGSEPLPFAVFLFQITRGASQFGKTLTDLLDLIVVDVVEKWQGDGARCDLVRHLKSSRCGPPLVNRLEMNRGEVSGETDPTHVHFPHNPIPMKLSELHS